MNDFASNGAMVNIRYYYYYAATFRLSRWQWTVLTCGIDIRMIIFRRLRDVSLLDFLKYMDQFKARSCTRTSTDVRVEVYISGTQNSSQRKGQTCQGWAIVATDKAGDQWRGADHLPTRFNWSTIQTKCQSVALVMRMEAGVTLAGLRLTLLERAPPPRGTRPPPRGTRYGIKS